jgi:hypothetical protein
LNEHVGVLGGAGVPDCEIRRIPEIKGHSFSQAGSMGGREISEMNAIRMIEPHNTRPQSANASPFEHETVEWDVTHVFGK